MVDFLVSLVIAGRYFFRSRADTALELLALRQQLAVLKRKRPRPALNCVDRAFWIVLRRLWPQWKDALVIVKPETVVGWHRAAFRFCGFRSKWGSDSGVKRGAIPLEAGQDSAGKRGTYRAINGTVPHLAESRPGSSGTAPRISGIGP
jgi:hypothetical protein